ncbi:MAG: stage II sporulation protein D [Clostridia bacterium]|nr:stage II sporulation protein D [Clostridia bacterium]
MRKWLVFFCVFFIFLSVITYFLTKPNESIVESTSSLIHLDESTENLKDEFEMFDEVQSGQSISMYRPEIDEVVQIDFYDYLRGVVASEMPADFSYSAVQAQAVVARTYFYEKKMAGHDYNCDICSSANHCQAYMSKDEIFKSWRLSKGWNEDEINYYWNKINSAVVSTDGIVITYNDEIIKAFFHASSPIRTEDAKEVWGKEHFPYLVSVESVESEDYKNRYSTLEVEKEYFKDKVRQELNENFELGDGVLAVNSYTDSSRVRDTIINGYIISSENLRKLFGLKSTLFTITQNDNSFVFHVTGYGHGVGMSQVGADYLGKNGKTFEEIIKHYYTGVELKKI